MNSIEHGNTLKTTWPNGKQNCNHFMEHPYHISTKRTYFIVHNFHPFFVGPFHGTAISYFHGTAISYFHKTDISYFHGTAISYFHKTDISYFIERTYYFMKHPCLISHETDIILHRQKRHCVSPQDPRFQAFRRD